MGGLVMRSLLALRPHDYSRLVRKWIAIASPFGGAPGFGMDALMTGVEFCQVPPDPLCTTTTSALPCTAPPARTAHAHSTAALSCSGRSLSAHLQCTAAEMGYQARCA